MFFIDFRRLRRFIIFCLLALGVLYLLQAKWTWRIIYPWPYRAEVTAAADKNQIDPYLLAAVIRVESNFNPQATSHAGARGLMQLMPDTGRMAAGNLDIDNFSADDLYDPQTNLQIGSWYLRHLVEQYGGNRIAGLAAYNAGHGKVSKWLEQGVWSGKLDDINKIPYKETREYITKVLKDYERYKYLYSGAT
jgi:soluble lytic murein transglycosylase